MKTNQHEFRDTHFANDREWMNLNLCKFVKFASSSCFYPATFCLCLLFVCSCATENSQRRLPATVSMSKNAGRRDMLIVTVRLEDGEKLPMIVDTGSSWTCFDKSLEPKLGKQLDTTTFWNFGVGKDSGIYAAPKLFWGSTLLAMTGTNVATVDFKQLAKNAGRAVSGLLGMDVLGHYCVQLDFAANRVRFLDFEHADKKAWGQPFPLIDSGDGCFYIDDNLAGVKGSGSLIDTGCDYDGWLKPEIFQQWTNNTLAPGKGESRFPNGVLGGDTYRELDLHRLDEGLDTNDSHMKFNGVGLHVLSQNLVTFDFPEKTMYLKRTSKWPLYDKSLVSEAKWDMRPAVELLRTLKKKSQLPGWAKKDQLDGALRVHFEYHHDYLDSITVDAKRKDDTSLYHYAVTRTKGSPWRLNRAWRTDQNGQILNEYPVPQNEAKR